MASIKIRKLASKFFKNNVSPLVIILSLMFMQLFALFTVSNWQKVDVYDSKANNELNKCIADIDNVIENLQEVMINVKLDNDIIAMLSKSETTPIEQQRILLKLSSHKKFMKEIKNIYIFDSKDNAVYSTVFPYKQMDEFPFSKTNEILLKGWDGKRNIIILDKADFYTSLYGNEKVVRIMTKYDGMSKDVIMADISLDTVREIFGDFEGTLGGKIYIRSSDGEILYGGNGHEEPPMELMNVGVEESKVIRSYYGKKYLVLRNESKSMDVDVFGIIPEEKMNSNNFQTRTLIVINIVIISMIILFGVFLFLAKNLRKAAQKHAKELEQMRKNDFRETLIKKNRPIITCFQHPTPEEIELCKKHIGLLFPQSNDGKIALARVEFCGMDNDKLIPHKTYNLIKQTEDIFNKHILTYAVYEHDNYILFLLGEPGFDHVARCRKAYQECCESFARIDMTPACYVSSASNIAGIRELYVEVSNLAEYTFIYNRPMFLDYTLVFQQTRESDSSIETGISGIKNNIMTPTEDLGAQMDTFINGLRELSVKDAKQTIYALYLAIGQCAEQIRKEDMSCSFDFLQYFPRLSALQSLDEARDLFIEMAEQLQKQHSETEQGKYAMIAKRSLEIIEQHLADPTLCRSMIADEIGISKPYLGRIFKEMVGISMSDAINDMRLKTAEEQLVSTNKSIKEIINDVGIVNQSYFTVMFKKKYGLSPSEYRNKKSNLLKKDE